MTTAHPSPAAPVMPSLPSTTTMTVVFGVSSIVLGALVLLLPGVTLLAIAVVFGVDLVLFGALRLAHALRADTVHGPARVAALVVGAISVVAGVFCFFRPGTSLLVLALLLAAGWIVDGVFEIVTGVRAREGGGSRPLMVVGGVVSILAGLSVAVFPGASLLLLTVISGVGLIVVGAAQLVRSLMGRRHAGTA